MLRGEPAFDDVWRRLSNIGSAVSVAEAEVLWKEARAAPRCVVEIGAWTGRCAILLATAVAPSGGHLHTVDPFDGTVGVGGTRFDPRVADVLQANLAKLAPVGSYTFHRLRSTEAAAMWDGPPVSFLWIDGDHTVEGTMRDFFAWGPLLTPKAKIALHDREMPGPRRVIEHAVERGWDAVLIAESLAVLSRP